MPNSILTRHDLLPSNEVMHVDHARVAPLIAAAWASRREQMAPIWSRPEHGRIPFDWKLPVEMARWVDEDDADPDSAAIHESQGFSQSDQSAPKQPFPDEL